MKKKILVIDPSVTVQKVVALTLDRNRYQLINAKSRSEAAKRIPEGPFSLILVSDQAAEVQVAAFPEEVEMWFGKTQAAPPIVLITMGESHDARGYASVLRKPFTPQALQRIVSEHTQANTTNENDDRTLHNIFNEKFADESELTKETLKTDLRTSEPTLHVSVDDWQENPPQAAFAMSTESALGGGEDDLWGTAPSPVAPPAPPRPAAPPTVATVNAPLELEMEPRLSDSKIEATVERVLNRILPAIVERLVQKRLDELLSDDGSSR